MARKARSAGGAGCRRLKWDLEREGRHGRGCSGAFPLLADGSGGAQILMEGETTKALIHTLSVLFKNYSLHSV